MCEKFSSGTIKQTYLRTKLSLQWIQQKVGWEDAHERHPTSPILISSQNAETHCRVKSRLIRNVHTKVDIPMVSEITDSIHRDTATQAYGGTHLYGSINLPPHTITMFYKYWDR